jgi:hypothetical protein
MGDFRMLSRERLDRPAVGDVRMLEGECVVPQQAVTAAFLQRHVVVVVQTIDPDDALAPGEQRFREVIANKPGGAGQQYRHRIAPTFATGIPRNFATRNGIPAQQTAPRQAKLRRFVANFGCSHPSALKSPPVSLLLKGWRKQHPWRRRR